MTSHPSLPSASNTYTYKPASAQQSTDEHRTSPACSQTQLHTHLESEEEQKICTNLIASFLWLFILHNPDNRTCQAVNKHFREGLTSKQLCKSDIIWGFEILQQPLTKRGVRWYKEVKPVAAGVSRALCTSQSAKPHHLSVGTRCCSGLGINLQEENNAALSHVITQRTRNAFDVLYSQMDER